MTDDPIITASARAIQSLAPAVSGMENLTAEIACTQRAIERGYFTPDEDERVRQRFAQYLGARAALLQTIADLEPIAWPADRSAVDPEAQLRAFVIGYTAVCLLVRAADTLVTQLASHRLVQRKLNEPESIFGIPRKQYTTIYRSLTSPRHALRIRRIRRAAVEMRRDIDALESDPDLAPVLAYLRNAEPFLERRFRSYAKSRLAYRWHSWRRRRASAMQQALFALLEFGGRILADIHWPQAGNRLHDSIRVLIEPMLEPGDVLVSRHDNAASNLFLPGYWPHASLHVGLQKHRLMLKIDVDAVHATRWVDPLAVLEARKDGVLLRTLTDTLAVDAVVVLRPTLDMPTVAAAISRAMKHEGKLYDFEFDFGRSDRLVCTEVIYRAYHGLGGVEFPLYNRAGRVTLAAEDIVTLALDKRGFEPAILFGTEPGDERIYVGDDAARRLAALRDRSMSASTATALSAATPAEDAS